MRFFLLDFALAFVALLGYRAVTTVAPALGTQIAPEPVLRVRPLHKKLPSSRGVGGRMACWGERAPHRLINFW